MFWEHRLYFTEWLLNSEQKHSKLALSSALVLGTPFSPIQPHAPYIEAQQIT